MEHVKRTQNFSSVREKCVLQSRDLPLNHQRTGCDGCLLPGMTAGCDARCAGRGAQGSLAEQGPCTPALCARAGILLLARVSTQPARGDPMAEAVGGRSDPQQDRVLLLFRGCCVVQGCSKLQITLGHICGEFSRAR